MVKSYSYDNLSLGPCLDKDGGQGIVYDVKNAKINASFEVVYKEYHRTEKPPKWEELRKIVEFRESLAPSKRRSLLARTAWPLAIVTREDGPVGVLMRKAPDDFWFTLSSSEDSKRKLAQVKHLLNSDEAIRRKGMSPPSMKRRYLLLHHASFTLALLHEAKVCAGDLSSGNLLFCFKHAPRTFFIDCDSMSLSGRSALVQKETINWKVRDTYPRESLATVDSDVYKLGLLALRMLVGKQNALRRDIGTLPHTIPPGVRDLIRASISKPAGQRPTAGDWVRDLAKATSRSSNDSASRRRSHQPRISKAGPSGTTNTPKAAGQVSTHPPPRSPSHRQRANSASPSNVTSAARTTGRGSALPPSRGGPPQQSVNTGRPTGTTSTPGDQSPAGGTMADPLGHAQKRPRRLIAGLVTAIVLGVLWSLLVPAMRDGSLERHGSLSVESISRAVNHQRQTVGLNPLSVDASINEAAVAIAEYYQREEPERRDILGIIGSNVEGALAARLVSWYIPDPTVPFDSIRLLRAEGDSPAHLGDYDRLGIGASESASGRGLLVVLVYIRDD